VPIDEVKTIGRMGKMQGDKTVIIPAKNAKAKSKIILKFDTDYLTLERSSFV